MEMVGKSVVVWKSPSDKNRQGTRPGESLPSMLKTGG